MSTNNKNKAFKKHLTLLCVIFALVITLINNFALSLVLSNIYGDIMYETAADLLSAFISAMSTLSLFLVYGVLVNSVMRFGVKKSTDIISLSFGRIVIIYASYIAIGAFVTTDFLSTMKNNYLYFLMNGLVDVMLLAGAVALCGFLRSKYIDEENGVAKKTTGKRGPLFIVVVWTTVLISAFLLSGCITDTVADITVYGASDLTTSEVLYLVTPYIFWLIKSVFGFFVMLFTTKWIDFVWKTLSEPKTESKTK